MGSDKELMVLDHQKLVEQWIEEKCVSEASRVTYLRSMRDFFRWARGRKVDFLQASRGEVIEWAHAAWKKNLKDRYRRKRLMILRSWFGWLEEIGQRNPIGRWRKSELRAFKVDDRAVHVACEARTRTALTRAEARRVWRWCAQEISGLKQLSVGLMLVGGLRAVEVSRISGNDVANNGQKLTVSGKGGKTRVVFFDGAVAKWLDSWVKSGEESPEIQSVYRAGKEAWEVAGRGQSGSSHGLRRTAATLLIERGATIDQVQEFLGHSSAATTARCYVIRRSRLPRLGIGR